MEHRQDSVTDVIVYCYNRVDKDARVYFCFVSVEANDNISLMNWTSVIFRYSKIKLSWFVIIHETLYNPS